MKYEYLIVRINNDGCVYDTLVKRYAKDAHHCARIGNIVLVCEADSCYYHNYRWMSDKVIRSYRKGKNNSRIWLQSEDETKIVPDWWERDEVGEAGLYKGGIS